jgi:hypothetical protein
MTGAGILSEQEILLERKGSVVSVEARNQKIRNKKRGP